MKRKRFSVNIAFTCAVVIGLLFFEATQSALQAADRAFEGPIIRTEALWIEGRPFDVIDDTHFGTVLHRQGSLGDQSG